MATQLPVLQKKRECGGCVECCTALSVVELGKPCGAKCEHVVDGGCRIYSDRPHTCRIWHCAWACGLVPEKYKPDTSGLVLDLITQAGQVMLSVYESRPGAADDLERIAYLVGRIRARQRIDHVFILPYGVRRGHPFPLDTAKYPEGEGLEDKWDTSEPVRGFWRVTGCRPPANAEEAKKVQARRESVPHRHHS